MKQEIAPGYIEKDGQIQSLEQIAMENIRIQPKDLFPIFGQIRYGLRMQSLDRTIHDKYYLSILGRSLLLGTYNMALIGAAAVGIIYYLS